MASTEEQDLNSQSSLSDLLSENETQSTTTMDLPKKETLRFESLPPEIRNIVYRHLFPPLCKGSRLRMLESEWPARRCKPPTYRGHDAYIYDTAILGSNRVINQEARSVLYGDNMFVHFNLTDYNCAFHMIVYLLRNIAWNHVRKGAPVPSCVVQIDHGIKAGKPAVFSMIVAAADVNLICKNVIHESFCCYGSRAAYFLVALPQLGWQHERLLTMIWNPLKALRQRRRIQFEEYCDDYYNDTNIKITDCTGVFEEADEMYEAKDSESGSLSESSSGSDPIEDESDGSGSEDSESRGDNSCDEEDDGEEDIEEVDRTSNGSDDVAQEESDGDEASTSGESGGGDLDEAASFKSHEHCNNNPRAKPSPCTASTSSHDADANAQITIFDNNATQG